MKNKIYEDVILRVNSVNHSCGSKYEFSCDRGHISIKLHIADYFTSSSPDLRPGQKYKLHLELVEDEQ